MPTAQGTNMWAKVKKWWRSHVLGQPVQPPTPSGYLTLIPLNGAYSQPTIMRTLLRRPGVVNLGKFTEHTLLGDALHPWEVWTAELL